MDVETSVNAGYSPAVEVVDAIVSEGSISMSSVSQFTSVVSCADNVSLQNRDGSSKEIPATHEPITSQEGLAEGVAIVHSYSSPRNSNAEESVGGACETQLDPHTIQDMENSDVQPLHHESPKHEESLAADNWPALPPCEEQMSSFNDAAPSAEPMIQDTQVSLEEPRGEPRSVFAEEVSRENGSMDWAAAQEPVSPYVSSIAEEGILEMANGMHIEDEATDVIDALPNEAAKESILAVHDGGLQNQLGEVTALTDPVAVVGSSLVIKEEEPSVQTSLFNEEDPAAAIPAIDLFESASIRELQNMLMDSGLKRPETTTSLHEVGAESIEGGFEIVSAKEPCSSDLDDNKMAEGTAVVEGEVKQESALSALNDDLSSPAASSVSDQQGLIANVATEQMKEFIDASEKADRGEAMKDINCSDPASDNVYETSDSQYMDTESKPQTSAPSGSEDLQEDELTRETEGEEVRRNVSSVFAKAEVKTDETMEVDNDIKELEGEANDDVQMDSEVVPAEDVLEEPQQTRKRGRKPGKKAVKNVEKDASIGLLQESEPEKEIGDSPSKQPMEGEQKRELRKRGRKPATSKVVQKEEEDVCFVCFDGGKLILCDKRSCPKAYHVECTGRESEFFEKKGQWFCGWHVCSQCSKSANLNCYLCPSALCSSCIKGANFLFIRKGRGLCEGCYPLVHMIEFNETVKGDPVQVDFNDKETYEGLFKEYWEELKLKHSLTSTEFKKACKAREAGGLSGEGEINIDEGGVNNDPEEIMGDENGGSSDSEDRPPTIRHDRLMKRKRLTRHSVPEDVSASEFEDDESGDEVKLESTPKKGRTKAPEFDGWASKDLADLIRSLKEDPKKPLPLFGVKKLLWRYIDDNKLTNPRKRGQIVCDERLRKLFGKKNVGRFEMMKLISLHVALPNKSVVSKGGELQFKESDTVELDDIEENQLGKKKFRRKGDDKRMKPDPSEYAAINVKNINLIYLKRSVLDELRNDPELESKAMGAFVRIRVPGTANKSDACYRLVQVVGVKQIYDALDPEKVTDVFLEILNLHKREEITADLVSNQELVEEECRRLRQSVRCGFIKAMRVGELEERARALREAKVKDWREFELLRLSHLRDRASEKGRKKELRECVEKLQLLSTPEEKERLLNAPFDIDADPFMDPDYESDEEELPADDSPVEISAPQAIQEKSFPPRFPDKGNNTGSAEKPYNHWDSGSILETQKSFHDTQQKPFAWGQKDNNVNLRQTAELQAQGLNSFSDTSSEKIGWSGQSKAGWGDGWGDGGRAREQTSGWNNQGNFGRKEVRWGGNSGANVQSSAGGSWRKSEHVDATPRFPVNQAEVSKERVFSPVHTPTPAALVSVANSGTMSIDSEKEKIWCYLDPTRTMQGPFTMEQLRKWEKTNLFPLDLRIWRVNESQDTAVLLSDALAGRFASRGSMGSSQKPSVALQGTHVNGIPVQGINANNFSMGQNGGSVAPGSAQGILSSPMPQPQRPVMQSFPPSGQGLNAHSFPSGPMQASNAQVFLSAAAPVHAPNINGFPTVPTQVPNVHTYTQVPTQGPYVNNFSAAPLVQGPNVTGYPPNVAQGINVLPGQVQGPMVMQGRPQGPNVVLGQMQGPNVLPGQSQAPNVMHGGPHFGNAPVGHPRGPHANHFPMGAAPGSHNNPPHMGQVVSSSNMDYRNANLPNRHSNEWQEAGRRSGPDQNYGGPSSHMMEAANEGGARVIPTRSPWRQGPSAPRQDHWDAHNRGPLGRAQNTRGSDHFQGNDGRFTLKKDLFCKYFSRGLCRKGQSCDFRHE